MAVIEVTLLGIGPLVQQLPQRASRLHFVARYTGHPLGILARFGVRTNGSGLGPSVLQQLQWAPIALLIAL
eukprot:IDg18681t1